jgi:RNA methyltransferase, TrmH family
VRTETGPLTSRSARVAAARRLLRAKDRARERAFLVEGPQAVREAVREARRRLARDPSAEPLLGDVLVTAAARERHGDVVDEAVAAGARVHVATDEAVEGLSGTVTPQGLVAVCRFVDVPLAGALGAPLDSGTRVVPVLVQVRDPGNAGAVLRVADAAGASAVVCTDGTVDVYNPKCVRASTGSLFHLSVTTSVPVPVAVAALRERGLQVLAADGAGATDLDEALDTGLLSRPTAWLFGNEAWGLDDDVLALADDVVRVPIHGAAESLNLATAAAVCLYASARARRGEQP